MATQDEIRKARQTLTDAANAIVTAQREANAAERLALQEAEALVDRAREILFRAQK